MDKFSKQTKIVATIGPASCSDENIKDLIEAGVNVFRLNTSHGTKEDHSEKFDTIRKVCGQTNTNCAIIIDLQGPKIRVGAFEGEIELKTGDEVIFSHNLIDLENKIIPVDYEGIHKDVTANSKILLDDGKIQAVVLKIEGTKVYVKITNGGILKPRKGLNIPGATNSLNALSERDIEYIKFAVEKDADYIALSFVRNKEDIFLAKKYLEEFNSDIKIISKLEKPQAIENLEEIIKVSDAIMVARGDLGIELSPVEVPIAQKKIISECKRQKKPVIVATQMLESMIEQPIPTRAESSDVANAILDGADAVMLSGETSIGKYPQITVKTMANIAETTENSTFYNYNEDFEISEDVYFTAQAIAYGIVKMLDIVKAKAIISFSELGYSTKLLSKLKPKAPIVMISNNEKTVRRMTLCWGVYPYYKDWDDTINTHIIDKIDSFLTDELSFENGDYVIIAGSTPKLISGKTNFIRVHKIGCKYFN